MTRYPTRREITRWNRLALTVQRKSDALFAETMVLGAEHELTDYTEAVRETVENLIHVLEALKAAKP